MLANLIDEIMLLGADYIVGLIIFLFIAVLRKLGIEGAKQHAEAFAPLIKEATAIGLKAVENKFIDAVSKQDEEIAAVVSSMPLAMKVLAPIAAKRAAVDALNAAKPTRGNIKRIQSLGITAELDGKAIGAGVKAAFRKGDLTVTANSKGKASAGFTFKF